MNNAEKFKKIFKEFATEVWAFPEKDFLTWLNAEYKEPTTKNDLGVDAVSRQAVLDLIADYDLSMGQVVKGIHALPSVTPQEQQTFKWCTDCKEYDQEKHCCHRWSKVIRDAVEEMKQEPKTGHCKDCKWWKDSDGTYRRGVKTESQCPINRKEVYEGNGYCFLYEPPESEDKE